MSSSLTIGPFEVVAYLGRESAARNGERRRLTIHGPSGEALDVHAADVPALIVALAAALGAVPVVQDAEFEDEAEDVEDDDSEDVEDDADDEEEGDR